jgi:hypothetical protein
MINKSKKAQFKDILGKILEPIALGIFALIFIIPSITVINLEPITKSIKEFTNVLGVTSNEPILIDLVGGTHEIVSNERIYKEGDTGYKYEAILTKRESDFYSKPILKLINNSEEDHTVSFLGSTLNPTRSDIGLIVNDQEYKLQNAQGISEAVEILLRPQSEYLVYLTVESVVGVQFSEELDISVTIN